MIIYHDLALKNVSAGNVESSIKAEVSDHIWRKLTLKNSPNNSQPAFRHVIIQGHHNMCTSIAHDQNFTTLLEQQKNTKFKRKHP
jgi:hypothetical protein